MPFKAIESARFWLVFSAVYHSLPFLCYPCYNLFCARICNGIVLCFRWWSSVLLFPFSFPLVVISFSDTCSHLSCAIPFCPCDVPSCSYQILSINSFLSSTLERSQDSNSVCFPVPPSTFISAWSLTAGSVRIPDATVPSSLLCFYMLLYPIPRGHQLPWWPPSNFHFMKDSWSSPCFSLTICWSKLVFIVTWLGLSASFFKIWF